MGWKAFSSVFELLSLGGKVKLTFHDSSLFSSCVILPKFAVRLEKIKMEIWMMIHVDTVLYSN